MNCANHADASAVAYCRTCGKALCANCTRPVKGVIYCEDCLGAKMGTPAAAPTQTPYQQFMDQGLGLKVAPGPVSGPNPTVAGILAGFFPVGVGAVYTGQYAKGMAHFLVAICLVFGASQGWPLNLICGLGCGFFYVYQIIDSVRSAKAIQASQPVPDPFGLAATFSGGAGMKVDTSKVPIGAIVLILVGMVFLLNTMGLEFGLDRFWPLILIFIGGWLFARNWGLLGPAACPGCQCARCRSRRIMGPLIVLTVGILFLLSVTLHGPSFDHTWPVILLVVGGVKLMQGSASVDGHNQALAACDDKADGAIPPSPPITPPPPVPPSSEGNVGEVNRG